MHLGSDNSGVTVGLQGGLGNQMFQYAAGRALAKKLQAPLTLDLAWFANVDRMPSVTSRRYQLDAFPVDAVIEEPHQRFWQRSSALIRLRNRGPAWLQRGRIYRELSQSFDPRFFELRAPVTLLGYFQSEHYFSSIRDEIRRTFSNPPLTGNDALLVLKQIQQGTSVALHVRRGDYVTNLNAANFHGVCDVEYYQSALRLLSTKIGEFAVFVFSDDPAWVRAELDLGKQFFVVDLEHSQKDIAELSLMAACDHFVIANSSFSWWAAWLGSNPAKQVIAPRRWFRSSSLNSNDLLPSGWLRL